MDNKITYLEVKRSLEATKEAIKEAELNIQIHRIILQAFERALLKYPKPMPKPLNDLEIHNPKPMLKEVPKSKQ